MSNGSLTKSQLFHIVSDWLKFAEAKNAALIAACGIFVPVLIKLASGHEVLGKLYGWSGITFLAVATFLSLVSFIPRLRVFDEKLWMKTGLPADASPIYFGDIALRSQEDFIAVYCKLYDEEDLSSMDRQLAIQTHVNARIAVRKFSYFGTACWCFLAAVFTPIAFVVLLLLSKNDDI